MPELPEVETVRKSLMRYLPGQKVEGVEVRHAKSVRGDAAFASWLVGRTVKTVDRRAKLLVIRFEDDDEVLAIHLKMTGQLLFRRGTLKAGGGHSLSKTVDDQEERHARVVLTFRDGARLVFNDLRLFGYLKRLDAVRLQKELGGYGPEPGTPGFTLELFVKVLGKRAAPLKAVLLDQKKIGGLGNIYVDEACFRAKVRPTRRAGSLTKAEVKALHRACIDVIEESIAVGGTTFRSYTDADGKSGGFVEKLRVYGRDGEKCLRCKGTIKKTVCAGRGTHYCPECQK
jgi:formamidopyrimidine-DNA glycosylase